MSAKDHGKIFCENMLRIRKENGLTQIQMADRLGIGIYTLRKIENGIIPPKLGCEIIFNVCREFDTTPENILSKP